MVGLFGVGRADLLDGVVWVWCLLVWCGLVGLAGCLRVGCGSVCECGCCDNVWFVF